MLKYLKYILVSSLVVCACAVFALAADDEPTTIIASVDGVPYYSIEDALSNAHSGQTVNVLHSTSFDGLITVPNGVTFNLPADITISTVSGRFITSGICNLYGSMVRTGSTSEYNSFMSFNGGSLNIYSTSYSTDNYGTLLVIQSNVGGSVKLYSGTFTGYTQCVYMSASGNTDVQIYGGNYRVSSSSSFTPLTSSITNLLPNGVSLNTVTSGDYKTSTASWGPLDTISSLVSSSIDWITLFCAAIVANKILLIFILVVFVGISIRLIRRCIDL